MGRSGEGQDGVGWRGWGLCSAISHSHQVLLCSGSHLGVLAMVGKSSESVCLLNSGPVMTVSLTVCLLSTWDGHRFRQLVLPSTPPGSQATRRSLCPEVMSPFKKTWKAV